MTHPTHLNGVNAYNDAPVGTIVLDHSGSTITKTSDKVWTFRLTKASGEVETRTYSGYDLSWSRPVQRWGYPEPEVSDTEVEALRAEIKVQTERAEKFKAAYIRLLGQERFEAMLLDERVADITQGVKP